MTRNTAREIAVHLAYELSFTDRTAEALLESRLCPEAFASLAEEDDLYREAPNAKQDAYIRRLVSGVASHSAELDGYIEKYAIGWRFARIPLMASSVMRVAMYEVLYMPDIPNASAIHAAVEIAKNYETPETVRFINGILGTFVRREIGETEAGTKPSPGAQGSSDAGTETGPDARTDTAAQDSPETEADEQANSQADPELAARGSPEG